MSHPPPVLHMSTLRRAAAVCAAYAAWGVASRAGAQTAPPAPAAPSAADAPAFPPIAPGDSATADAVERLLQVSDAERGYNQAVALSVAAQARSNPAVAAHTGVMRAFIARYASYAAVHDDLVRVYRETYTAAEVQELTRFYASDFGRRLAAKQPLVAARANELLSLRLQAHLPALIEALQADARGNPAP